MFRIPAAVVVLPAVVLLGAFSPAHAQSVSKGTLSGTIVSDGAAIPASSTTPVFTAPPAANGFFVLTQLCTNLLGCATFSGSTVGAITPGGSNCTEFSPGLALAGSEVISVTEACAATYGTVTVTGILSKK